MEKKKKAGTSLGLATLLGAVLFTQAGPARADSEKKDNQETGAERPVAISPLHTEGLGAEQSFEILPAHTVGQCLDVYLASLDPLAVIIQHNCHGGMNQRWSIHYVGGGEYEIRAMHSGQCLDVPYASLNPGTQLIQSPCWGGANQHFRINADASGAYELRAVHSDQCMDIEYALTTPGAHLKQYPCSGGRNQRFYLQPR